MERICFADCLYVMVCNMCKYGRRGVYVITIEERVHWTTSVELANNYSSNSLLEWGQEHVWKLVVIKMQRSICITEIDILCVVVWCLNNMSCKGTCHKGTLVMCIRPNAVCRKMAAVKWIVALNHTKMYSFGEKIGPGLSRTDCSQKFLQQKKLVQGPFRSMGLHCRNLCNKYAV